MFQLLFPFLVILAGGMRAAQLETQDGPSATAPAAAAPVEAASTASHSTFIENVGQWPETIRFAAVRPGLVVRAECDGIGFDMAEGNDGRRSLVRLAFQGTSSSSIAMGVDPEDARFHYFLGNDASKWHSNARAFASVLYRDLYQGVDLVLRCTNEGVKYDLIVAPGADLSAVQFRIEGLPSINLFDDGAMAALGQAGFLLHVPGRSYEEIGEEQKTVSCSWQPLEPGLFGLSVEGWDTRHRLVIDPELLWSTYLGSSVYTLATATAFTRTGDLVVAGWTNGTDFPQTPGAYQNPNGVQEQCFVTKFRGQDGQLIFSSVFGGTNIQRPVGIAVDQAGELVVTGATRALDFPTTPGAYDTIKTTQGSDSGFVTKLSPNGSQLLGSTYLEGPANGSSPKVIAALRDGSIIVAGVASQDFPTTSNAFQTQSPTFAASSFISHLNATCTILEWSTFLCGSGSQGVTALTCDPSSNILVAGPTTSFDFPTTPGVFQQSRSPLALSVLFVTKLNSSGSSLVWSTYLGGAASQSETDYANGIAQDSQGNVLVAGTTNGYDFPTTSGAFLTQYPYGTNHVNVGFLSKLSNDGSTLLRSTLLADPANQYGTAISSLQSDASGVPTVLSGGHAGFPTTPGAFDTSLPPISGIGKNAIVRFSPTFDRLFYSTFLGGPNYDGLAQLAEDANGRMATVGYCEAPGGWPVTLNAFQYAFPSGGRAGTVTAIDLFLQGLTLSGLSTPSCLGPLTINGTSMPVAGSTHFSVYCSGAPPRANGCLFLGTPGPALYSIGGTGLGIHPYHAFQIIPVQADPLGYVETYLPIPANAIGTHLTAQYVFQNTATCSAGTALSSSRLLTITVQ